MTSIIDDPLVRIKDLPPLLGVTLRTLQVWRQKGILPPPVQIGPRARGYHKSTLDKFIATRKDGA